MKKLISLLCLTFAFSTHAQTLTSPSPSLRLIETAPNTRTWMGAEQIQAISKAQHEAGKCGGYMDVTENPVPSENHFQKAFSAIDPIPQKPSRQNLIHPLLSRLSADRMHQSVSHLSKYLNRYYQSETGVQSAEWIRSEFERMSNGRNDITIEVFPHRWKQPSIIARIQGKNSSLAHVVLGAHQDSIQHSIWGDRGPKGEAPGADDDASGVATLLETFKVIVDSGIQLDRTIEFMAYAAEEVGLLGSQAIAESYRKKNIPIAGVIQFDMTLFPGSGGKMVLINDHVDQKLTQFTATLIDEYVKIPWAYEKCSYSCSDHASWTRSGYPSAFPFEALMRDDNKDIHTPRDTIDKLDFAYGLHFAKLALAYSIEMGIQ